jgi:hypothetical protein
MRAEIRGADVACGGSGGQTHRTSGAAPHPLPLWCVWGRWQESAVQEAVEAHHKREARRGLDHHALEEAVESGEARVKQLTTQVKELRTTLLKVRY